MGNPIGDGFDIIAIEVCGILPYLKYLWGWQSEENKRHMAQKGRIENYVLEKRHILWYAIGFMKFWVIHSYCEKLTKLLPNLSRKRIMKVNQSSQQLCFIFTYYMLKWLVVY